MVRRAARRGAGQKLSEKVNDLQLRFEEHGSEIETVARDCIGMDFDFIACAYGFTADIEELIAPREW